jgi:uncharacterized membrane protein
VHAWSAQAAVVAALGFLVLFWIAYDLICRLVGERHGKVGGDGIVGGLVLVYVVAASWAACHLFAGRAAFLMVGAMLATAMSANVFFWIIPGQRKVIAQMKAGQRVDPIHGQRAKQRSVHNTYFTLPVLVAMLSNHYGWLYEGSTNWLVLSGLMLAGALIRHSFVARHKALVQQRRVPWEFAGVGVAGILGLAVWLAPAMPAPTTTPAGAASSAPVSLAQVQAVVDQRCVLCHNAQVQNKGVALNSAALIQQHAQQMYQQVVVLKAMPFNNATGITDAERDLIRRWYEGGGPAR